VFDIGTGEVIALAVIALLVLGPDKLPRYAAEAARFLRQIRTLANDARNEVRRELGPELEGLDLRELNPRSIVRKHVLDGVDGFDDLDADPAPPPRRTTANGSTGRTSTARNTAATGTDGAGPPATPYDTDAT
jgi:sec-independent protein translocase protein TatB